MSDEVRSIYEAADRMDAFGDGNTDLVAELPIAVEMFAELKTVKQGLEQAGASRSSSGSEGRSETQSKAAVYNSIYRRMRRFANTAAIIKKREPDFNNKYLLPRDKMPYQEGLERAKAIYADSNADAVKFRGYGLTPVYREALNTDITAFENSGQGQIDAKLAGVGKTAKIDALVEQFMNIHEPLNQMMKNLLMDDPQKLAEWKSAAHIERKKSRPQPEEESPVN